MNFIKLFTDYKIPYSTKVNRGWVNSNCPYCDTKTDAFNMGFNPVGDYCTCWKCGGHNLKETLSKLLNIPKNQIEEVIENYKGRNSILNALNKRKCLVNKLELPTDTFTPAERKYLKSRNFSPKYLHEKYGVVGGGITGKWKYRIIIPLYMNGKLVSWTGRSILSKEKIKELQIPRYKNLSIEESVIDVKSILFNLDNCVGKTVVLTEGPMDVLRFDGNCVCSFGTSMTQEQIKIIASRFNKVYVLFDNEIEAQKKARKYGMELSSLGVDVEVVEAYSDFNKNDMDECTEQEIKEIKTELGL